MKRYSEYSFKDPAFTLGDIGTFKCEVIKQLAIAIDDIIFPDGETGEDKHTDEKLIAFLYEIRGKAEEIDELMSKLDRELGEMGVGYYKDWKKEDPQAATVNAAQRIDQIERGEVDMTVSELEKISAHLECSPFAILDGEDSAFAIMTAPGMEEPMRQLADLKKKGADINKIVAAMVREYETNENHEAT